MPTSNIDWQFFPKSVRLPPHLEDVIKSLDEIEPKVSSLKHKLESDKVLAFARNGLEELGYKVETGKKDKDKIQVPVLFGKNGKLEKLFKKYLS